MSAAAAGAFFFTLIHSPLARVLDDFNDNKVTGWEKFDFGSGNGFFKEEDGQFTIGMHQPTGQPFFVAATYGSETFTIKDGVTLEFQIDLIVANQAEAYAAVGFIPTDTPVSKLSGYSAVKDNDDVILAKGLNKFFYDITDGAWTETPENITLSISMTGKGENVVMTVKVLDIENNNAVLFEETSIDTPNADDFQTGTDAPAGTFMGKPGNFVVLLYHNDTNGSLPASSVTLDNARVFQYENATLDDFNDDKVTDWEKFDFGSGNGFLKEEDGQFTIGMHQPPGQPFFVAATYEAKTFTIEDGTTIEFSVDLIGANQPDSFAVLSFIPKDNPVSTLIGYSLAKDINDILLAKGLGKYFYDKTEGDWIEREENIRLVLSMTGTGNSVEVTTRVLDLENNQAVLFEETVIDTVGVDNFETGDADDPPASFIGKPGNFVLLLYHNDTNGSLPASSVTLDNARAIQYESATLDNFNDDKVTDWEKFDFGSGNGFLKEEDGQLTIGMHQPPGQPFFVAATYESKTFTIEDGTTIEFSVDLIGANQADAFAVLSFIPKDSPVSTLTGYSVAKDINDVLLAKGLNKYFYDITEGEWIDREENIRLVLSMTGSGKSVEITTRVLDLENNQAVLFEETVIDTAEAEELDTGNDSPPASFIDKPGNFVLLLYHNDTNGSLPASSVTLDNAHVSVFGSASENQPPIITAVSPVTSSLFLPASTKITFGVNDDQGVEPEGISVTLNGTNYNTGNGLTVGGTATAREVSLGGLTAGVNYHAVITAADADGETDIRYLYFDTFDTNSFVVEVEDYNYEWGEFIDDPVLIPELDEGGIESNWGDNSFNSLEGSIGIDFFDTNESLVPATHRYRPYDGVSTAPALDLAREKFIKAGGSGKGVYDFGVSDIEEGEWLNYTRTYPNGDYLVYLRQAQFDMSEAKSTLELVTSATDVEEQTTEVLGSFLGSESGVEFRNVPLTDEAGKEPVIVKLGGKATLRLAQHTTDPEDLYLVQNYLVFIKYEKPSLALQVSSAVNGPYKTNGGAAIDEASRTVTLGQAGATQFYRLSGGAVTIKSIQVANGKVTLKYE